MTLHLHTEFNQGLADSKLLEWLAHCPLVAIIGDALISHAGISTRMMHKVDAYRHETREKTGKAPSRCDALHRMTNEKFVNFFENHVRNETFKANSIKDPLDEDFSTMISDVVEYRGYFGKSASQNVNSTKIWLNNRQITRLVVGHTPQEEVHSKYGGQLLAVDSMLSRYFRVHGNYFCPMNEDIRSELSAKRVLLSRNCRQKPLKQCHGNIARISRSSPSEEWSSVEKLNIGGN